MVFFWGGGICFCCCQGVSLLRTHLRAKSFGGDTRCTKCKERVFGGEDHKKYRSVCILLRYTSATGIVLSLTLLITSMLELSGTNIRTGSYMEHGTILQFTILRTRVSKLCFSNFRPRIQLVEDDGDDEVQRTESSAHYVLWCHSLRFLFILLCGILCAER
jgi:hypothetical protein